MILHKFVIYTGDVLIISFNHIAQFCYKANFLNDASIWSHLRREMHHTKKTLFEKSEVGCSDVFACILKIIQG